VYVGRAVTTLICLAALCVGYLTALAVGLSAANMRMPLKWTLALAGLSGGGATLLISTIGLRAVGALP
jgi:hypothetical protein